MKEFFKELSTLCYNIATGSLLVLLFNDEKYYDLSKFVLSLSLLNAFFFSFVSKYIDD